MTHSPAGRLARVTCLLVVAASLLRCAGTADGPHSVSQPDAAKAAAGGGPAVTAVSPSYGQQGQIGEQVTITGSGFDAGTTVAWERAGTVDPKIRPYNTVVVSSTQITTTIDIAGDANLSFYDIAVTTSGRKKGIGTELFEVTQATAMTSLGGVGLPRDVNSSGLVTGRISPPDGVYQPVLWMGATDMVNLGTSGTVWAADELGTTVAGNLGSSSGAVQAVVWTGSGSAWQMAPLPTDFVATESRAMTVASDATGAAVFIGGGEWYNVKRGWLEARPRVWRRTGTGWTRTALQMPPGVTPATGQVTDINAKGQAVSGAIVWEPVGAGWIGTLLTGSSQSAHGIAEDGAMVVGASGGYAAYWQRLPDGRWGSPVRLPDGCAWAKDVDAVGRILVVGCQGGGFKGAALIAPPYTTLTYLGGLGVQPHEGGTIEGMSERNGWIVGSGGLKTGGTGIYWQIP
jgi:hypothetical protein